MARKQQNDPLRYAANLTALAAAVYLGVTALLRLAVGQLLRLFNKSATLENPIAVPEWVLGVFNVLLPAAGLAAAFWLLAVGVRATPMRLRISVQMPRDGRLWLFVPVFLGAGFLCSLLTTLLQRLLAAFTRYRAPEAIRLPQSGFATFLYFIGMCVVPAVLEELLVRGRHAGSAFPLGNMVFHRCIQCGVHAAARRYRADAVSVHPVGAHGAGGLLYRLSGAGNGVALCL